MTEEQIYDAKAIDASRAIPMFAVLLCGAFPIRVGAKPAQHWHSHSHSAGGVPNQVCRKSFNSWRREIAIEAVCPDVGIAVSTDSRLCDARHRSCKAMLLHL